MAQSAAQRVEIAQRERRAVDLRIAGLTLQQISDTLGLGGRQHAKRMTDRGIGRDRAASVAEWRALTVERLETAHRVVWPRVLQGDLLAVDRMLRISERVSKLLGMDEPMKATIVADGVINVVFDRALEPRPMSDHLVIEADPG